MEDGRGQRGVVEAKPGEHHRNGDRVSDVRLARLALLFAVSVSTEFERLLDPVRRSFGMVATKLGQEFVDHPWIAGVAFTVAGWDRCVVDRIRRSQRLYARRFD